MSRIIATAAIRGAHVCVKRAESMLKEAIVRHGRDAAVGFENTAYALPVILALTGQRVERLSDLQESLQNARKLVAGRAHRQSMAALPRRRPGRRHGHAR